MGLYCSMDEVDNLFLFLLLSPSFTPYMDFITIWVSRPMIWAQSAVVMGCCCLGRQLPS